jgi:HNH endonuclease
MRYPAIGKCIYCGCTSKRLTEEHIIPLGLGGDLILPEASCEDCNAITGTVVEGPCLQKMLIAPRTHWKIKTRRPKKRPTMLPVGIGEPEKDFEWRGASITDHPLAFGLPVFAPAGILTNEPPRREFHLLTAWAYKSDEADDRLKAHGETAGMWQWFSPELFCRMLAKIAHSFVVAELHLDSFVAFLPDIILGRSEIISHHVGGTIAPDVPPTSTPAGSELQHDLAIYYRSVRDGPPVVSATVQLFSTLHAPVYEVIVGRMLAEPIE